jgi:hypothetical protein
MSQEQFYQTVQMQEEYMKTFLEEAKENLIGVFYCPYCMEPKGHKLSCCKETHFLEFQDFDDATQTKIVQEEYDLIYGSN